MTTIQDLHATARRLQDALSGVVVGQPEATTELVVAWLAGGHVLLEGVPGVGKTLLAHALAGAFDLQFGRIQFTPDLMPADITGANVFDFQQRLFELQRGPVFCQVLLADEINRAPPQDAGGAAGGDAGAAGDDRRHLAPAGRRVLRGRHPEPAGARGHLPLA